MKIDRKKKGRETMFEVIRGGLAFEDPNEICGPDKPIEEWTAQEHEAFFLACWNAAEDSTLEYAVKNLQMPAESINIALEVLEAISQACADGASRTGLRNEFDYDSLNNLLDCLRQRVKEDNKKTSSAK